MYQSGHGEYHLHPQYPTPMINNYSSVERNVVGNKMRAVVQSNFGTSDDSDLECDESGGSDEIDFLGVERVTVVTPSKRNSSLSKSRYLRNKKSRNSGTGEKKERRSLPLTSNITGTTGKDNTKIR